MRFYVELLMLVGSGPIESASLASHMSEVISCSPARLLRQSDALLSPCLSQVEKVAPVSRLLMEEVVYQLLLLVKTGQSCCCFGGACAHTPCVVLTFDDGIGTLPRG